MNKMLLTLKMTLIVGGVAQAGHHEEENNISSSGVQIFEKSGVPAGSSV